MIANVRGTSGSGKSTLVNAVLDRFEMFPLIGVAKKYDGYANPAYRINVVGDYRQDCGGCDQITEKGKAQDIIQNRVREYAALGDVVFEGLLISHIYGRYRDMALNEYPGSFTMALMDTPLELCLQRVQERRDASGRARGPFNPDNTIKMYEDVLKIEQKCKADGVPYVWLDHNNAFEHLMLVLGRHAPHYRFAADERKATATGSV